MFTRNKPLQRRKPLGPGKKSLARSGWRKKPNGTSTNRDSELEEDVAEDDTDARAHRALWALLRENGINGFIFREHERIGPYVVNFYCPAAKLAVDIRLAGDSDAARTAWLTTQGIRLTPLKAREVLADSKAALDRLAESFTLRVISREEP
ncbi:very-short-patch-repair endonuclease [Rhizomicrobium palustre]|uniref:Very-short-patch-repair endonuclease n=1 Tax=Rhizomicrobium palustre TaxID=189966 RepID=A0A846MTC2_9PROT|nr:DUF559 domain-containing protein [Rhizomicrobium palustre]NIK86684.1 very-short-patch-repair endonuclease [Rhizomicrobium palustre]